jgi:hypothetical protein
MPHTLDVRTPVTALTPTVPPAAEIPEVAPVRKDTFTPEEIASFHADDKHAGAAIAGIMMAIFAAALIAYIFIACWVFTWPM